MHYQNQLLSYENLLIVDAQISCSTSHADHSCATGDLLGPDSREEWLLPQGELGNSDVR